MSKIIEYDIIEKENSEDLKFVVNKRITEGWEPHGELIVIPETDLMNFLLMQPIIKREEPK